MTKSFALSLIVVSALATSPHLAFAKATIIPGQNNGTFAAACDRSKTCINWGGGIYTNGDTRVICTKKKCVKVEEDAPARTGSNGNRGNDPSGDTVGNGGGKGQVAGSTSGNPSSMGGGGASIN